MNRIPLNYTQRQSLHPLRKDIEARIRELKKQLRGKPHTASSYEQQSALSALRHVANALYTLLAGARGHEHAPKRTEATLKWLRVVASTYTSYWKGKREPYPSETLGLLLLEAEAKAPTAATAA